MHSAVSLLLLEKEIPPNMVAHDLLWSHVELLVHGAVKGDVMNL